MVVVVICRIAVVVVELCWWRWRWENRGQMYILCLLSVRVRSNWCKLLWSPCPYNLHLLSFVIISYYGLGGVNKIK